MRSSPCLPSLFRIRWRFAALLLLACYGVVPAARAQFAITEFMAANTRTLADEDGEFSDWIELHCTATNATSLGGWFLTDDSSQRTKWRFPEKTLTPGEFLVVFASNKDRRTVGLPLHTNFRLGNSGEYLALVRPDGVTVATEFAPVFPPQVSDVSFGLDAGLRKVTLIASNAPMRWLVPGNGADGTNWSLPAFSDASWRTGNLAAGFADGSISGLNMTNSLAGYWRFDETTGLSATDASGEGHPGALRNFPADNSQWVGGRIGGALRFRGSPSADFVYVTNYAKSTNQLTVAAWVLADARPVWASVAKNWTGGNASHFHLGLTDTTGDLSNYIRQNNADYGLRENVLFPTGSWQHVAFVLDASAERLYRNGALVAQAPYSGSVPLPSFGPLAIGAKLLTAGGTADSFWQGRIDEVAVWNRALTPAEMQQLSAADNGYSALMRTDTRSSMSRSNATLYLRVPFVVENPQVLTRWVLRMRYDDGFVAWLNGEEIIRRNAPETLAWNSAATTEGPAEEESFNLAAFEQLFFAGTNVLAIQGLNISANDSDFLIAPTLTATTVEGATNTTAYFTEPTPGAANLVGVQELGPILRRATHTPAEPTDNEDLAVTVQVTPAFGAVTNVTLTYRVMYSNEVALAMFDDGAHGDGLAGDGIFGASIPAAASTNGQLVRYSIRAQDSFGRSSRLPLFNDPADSDQYFGTVVRNPAVATPLPLVQWFVQSPSLAETDAGTRCSLYYNGELYDNVFVRIRGGTARSWPKKSYKIELNENHEFLPRPGWRRVTEFDLNATYTDKSYTRAVMTAEMGQDAGVPSPETFHVHLRQNGTFYSVANFVEQPDKDFLIRQGLDPLGSLYKCGPGSTYDNVTAFEKKTRLTEDKSDAQALINGLTLTGPALENFVFDAIDVPAMVNFMAVVAITQNIDASDKNHFLYRDTQGSGEWRMLPWDLDLTFGPDALNTDTIVYQLQNPTAPACASHPFIGARPYLLHSGKYNRLLEAIVNVPRSRQMLLRRIRTLSDDFIAARYFENRIAELVPYLTADVALDRARWGANAHFPGTTYTLAAANDRIKNEYLTPRYGFLTGPTIAGVTNANPALQPLNAVIAITEVEFNPVSGNQAEEFLVISNTAPFPMDISGWKLDGAVQHTFKPGTVIATNSVLYVSPNVAAFRQRTTAPRGGQGLFVQGNYEGRLSARGETVRVLNSFGAVVHSRTYPGQPSLAQQYLRVTELMYHPAAIAGNTNAAEDFEFVELRNISTNTPLDLRGVRFTAGIEFDFTNSTVPTLPPGGRLVLARNAAALMSLHGPLPNLAGQYAGSLDNDGERLQLLDATGEEIHDFTYSDGWYPITDGLGFSLVTVDDTAAPESWNHASQWRAGHRLNGSPTAADSLPTPVAPIFINEILSRTDVPPPLDSIELFNPNAGPVNIGGWFLSDDFATPKKFRIPDGVTLAPGGYRVFTEADFNLGGTGFALSSDGDEAWIFSADAAGNLTGWAHGTRLGAADNGVSFGRYITSTGDEMFVAQTARSFGTANGTPAVGPVVISEIMYRPMDFADGSDNSIDEFIELRNSSTTNVALFDAAQPTNTWRLSGGVDFSFPPGRILTAGNSLLLVNFDPATDLTQLEAFRIRYAVDDDVQIVGPYSGKLSNDGDDVELKKPTTQVGAAVPYVLVDKVDYTDATPWPAGADGYGLSLQRVSDLAYGNDPVNWIAAPPTAGATAASGATMPSLITSPQSQTGVLGAEVSFNVLAAGSGPLRYQWRFNGVNLAGETNVTLRLPAAQPAQAGTYQVVVFNTAGSVASAPAELNLIYPATFLAQPQNVTLRGSTNVADYGGTTNRSASFSVLAYSPEPIRYQWRFNQIAIPGATNATLTVTNVTLASDGVYDVLVTDTLATRASSPSRLTVLLNPQIIISPVNQFVVQGGSFTAGVQIRGNPTPFGYFWRFGSANAASIISDSTNSFLTRNNVQPSNAGLYRIVITNAAQPALSLNATFTVTVLADADRDGLADAWEIAAGLDTNNVADAALDLDGDKMTNLQEFIAGTDPVDPLSYLKIEPLSAGQSSLVSFQAISNRTYSIESTSALGAAPWVKVADVHAATTNRFVNMPLPFGPTNRLYRLVTPASP